MNDNTSRTKIFLNNTVATAFYQVVLFVSGFIIPRILIVNYGSEINGIISSLSQFITYFNLVESGIAGAGVYALYKPLADKDKERTNSILSAVRRFYFQAGYIFLTLVIGLAILFPLFIHTEVLSFWSLVVLIMAIGSKGFMEFFTLAKYRVLLTADQKTYVISLASAVYIALNTLVIIVLASNKIDIVIVYVTAISALFVRMVILFIYTKNRYKGLNYKAKPDTQALDRRWPALVLQILGSVQSGMPTILATFLTNFIMVSIYSIYNMVLMGINNLLSIFISGLAASFGDIIARREVDTLKKAYSQFEFAYYTLIAMVYSLSFVLIMPFIEIYTLNADISYYYPWVGFWIVLQGLIYNLKTPQGMLVISAGYYRETMWRSGLQASLIVFCGFIFGVFWGIEGIIIGSCIGNLYRDIDLLFYIPKKITHLPVRNTLKRWCLLFLKILLITVPLVYWNYPIYSISDWFLAALLYGIYALVVVLTVVYIFEKGDLLELLARFRVIRRR